MFNFDDKNSPEKSVAVISLRAAKQSAEERRRDIFDSHRHRIFALAYYMTGDELAAEKILTDTFVDAFGRTQLPDAPQVDQALVGQLRAQFPIGEEEPAPVATPAEDLSGRNVRRTDLEEAIQFLPATERLLFLMRDVEGYPVEKISQILDIPEAAVQRSLFAARLRLRSILSNEKRAEAAA